MREDLRALYRLPCKFLPSIYRLNLAFADAVQQITSQLCPQHDIANEALPSIDHLRGACIPVRRSGYSIGFCPSGKVEWGGNGQSFDWSFRYCGYFLADNSALYV